MGAPPPRPPKHVVPKRPRTRVRACPCDLKPGDITVGRAYGKPFGVYVACPACGERDVLMLRQELGGEPQAFEEGKDGAVVRLEPGWLCRASWCRKRVQIMRGAFVLS